MRYSSCIDFLQSYLTSIQRSGLVGHGMNREIENVTTIPPLLIMGVTGSGKTTCGRRLSEVLGIDFLDADDFHSADNIARMRAGIPLGDAQRQPWLWRLSQALVNHEKDNGPVLACSALKRKYRNQLRLAVPSLRVIYLRSTPALIKKRLKKRSINLISPDLINSQFEDLEEPKNAIEIDALDPAEHAITTILIGLGLEKK